MKMTFEEGQDRWAKRADAVVEGPPHGYRFCHVGGHFSKVDGSCSCKVNTDASRQSD